MTAHGDLWDLTGRGEIDRARYRERIKEALRRQLGEVITHEDVVTAPSGKTVRVRIEDIHEPRFRYDDRGEQGTPGGSGSGDPEDGLIGQAAPSSGSSGAGEGHTEGRIVEITLPVEDVADWIFSDLQLPRVQKRGGTLEDSEDTLTARGRQGVIIDKKRTLVQHALREKASGRKEAWRDADRIYRRWEVRPEASFRAVVVLVRDASASMDERMRFVVRTVCWWTVLWLRRNYAHVDVCFVLHDTQGKEVTEEQFFQDRAMGGTHISSGLVQAEACLERFPPGEYNRYVCFFSDGDNWSSDAERLEQAVRRLAGAVELLAYGQVMAGPSAVLEMMRRVTGFASLRFGHVDNPTAIRDWLLEIFGAPARRKEA